MDCTICALENSRGRGVFASRSRGSDRAFVGRMHVRDGSISSANSGRFTPHRDVKTTRGGDSHFDSPAIHTAPNLHPLCFQRLAASRPGRQLPNGPLWPWPERPPAPRAWCGIEASVYSHPRPCLPGVAPGQQSHAGRRKTSRPGASRSWSPMPDTPTASRSPNTSAAAEKRRSTPFRDGSLAGSDPRGRGRRCANAHGPEPVAGPRTAGSLPAPPERSLRPRPPGTARRKTFARSSFRRPAGAHRLSAEVRIGPPRRLRARVRPRDGGHSSVASSGEACGPPGTATAYRPPLGLSADLVLERHAPLERGLQAPEFLEDLDRAL